MAASSAARGIPGVLSVDDDVNTTSLTIVYDTDKTTIEVIKNKLKDAKYPVEKEEEAK